MPLGQIKSKKIKKLYLLVFILFACSKENKLSELDEYINSSLSDWNLPGLAVAVVLEDKIIFAEGFGVKELGKNDRIDEYTNFQIGSLTKGFAAAAIATLVDDGSVNWDDPVNYHLPWFKLKDINLSNQITIRDLLAHISGMPAHAYPALEITNGLEVAKRAQLLDNQGPLRKEYKYSNQGYGLTGLLVEEVTQQSWGDWVKESLFRPLKMTNSYTSPYDVWDSIYVAPTFIGTAPKKNVGISNIPKFNVAMPHGIDRNNKRKILPWQSYDNLQAAGSMVSNVMDMANWIRMHLNEGEFENKPVISKSNLMEMHTPQIETAGYFLFADSTEKVRWRIGDIIASPIDNYGMGWSISTFQGEDYLYHGGGIFGFPAFASLLPNKKAGVVVLTNGSLWTPYYPHQEITAYVYEKLFDLESKDWHSIVMAQTEEILGRMNKYFENRELERKPNTKPTLPMKHYIGTYGSPLAGPFEIKFTDGVLRLEFHGVGAFSGEIEHWYDDTFLLYYDGGDGQHYKSSLITFKLKNKKRVIGIDLGAFGEYHRIL